MEQSKTSPVGYLADCMPSGRSEAEVRARRARLEADLLDEGASEATVTRLATPAAAERMLAYESRVVAFIGELFTGVGAGIK